MKEFLLCRRHLSYMIKIFRCLNPNFSATSIKLLILMMFHRDLLIHRPAVFASWKLLGASIMHWALMSAKTWPMLPAASIYIYE